MNQVKHFFFRLFMLMECISYCGVVIAYDFQVDGLYYNIKGTNEVYIPFEAFSKKLSGDIIVPETVKDYEGNLYTVVGIGEYAFAGSKITSIQLPNTIRYIDQYAFSQCSQLKTLQLPKNLESIGKAFISSSGITHIKIPNSVTKIADRAFGPDINSTGCQLESIDLSELSSSIIELPEGMFRSCRLKSIEIPNSIVVIRKEAFMGCGNLKTVILPESLSTIETQAFYNCSSLESINLPDQISSIGSSAFWGCSSLKTIKIPSSLNRIEDDVFLGCQNLMSVEFPEILTEINRDAFSGCKSLKDINLPSSLKTIGIEAFSSCQSLTKIVLPASLTSIGKGAFMGCSSLNEVESKIKEPFETYAFSSFNSSFSGAPSNPILYVPSGTKDKYVKCYGWGNFFKEVIEKIDSYTLSITASGNGTASYNNTTIRSKTSNFTVNEGTNATISFAPDNGCRIKSVKVNNSTVSVSNNQYTISSINANTSVSVEFEAIPVTTYTLSITASGNGSASYSGTTIRSKTSSFSVNAGVSATITFSPDNGYRIRSVKVNNSTVSVSNNQYTISNINANTSVSVEFEAIPVTTYTLSITASGNGSASYGGTTIRSKTSSFSVNAGSSVTITFSPDNGYRIKSVKVNNTTVSVSNNQYTISSINANTTVSVEFEAIPVTTYTLSITVSGNGSVTYGNTSIRSKISSFTVNQGSSATITFSPDNGYRIKSVKVNNSTVSVSNNQYTISSINANTSVSVEFEAIPVTTYTLSITASGNGSVSYSGTTIRSKTSSFSVNAGSSVTITFSPDNGYRIKSVKVNNTTVSVSNNQYTISSINANTTVSVEFEAIPVMTYTLSISVSGNGSASYSGNTIRSKTSSFNVNAGVSATITFSPDNGYRIKSVKVNNTTVSISNNQYTISSINANTNVFVEFEAIPITTYTMSITASGNGSASYGSTTVRGKTSSFTVNEGTSATITFSPDNGYQIKSVKVNSSTVTFSNNQYTVSDISRNTTVEVEFEAIPPTTYTLSITASGYGSASYDGTNIRNRTSSFTVNEGTSAIISFSPDDGYRIKNVWLNNSAVSVSNNRYTISSISRNTTLEVEFEAIPPTTYTLSITASGYGSVLYDGTSIRNRTSSFTVTEGTSATISFSPDDGYRIKNVWLNNSAVSVSNNRYTISSISRNTTLEVEFEAIPPTTYTLSITASGYGSASYDGTSIRNRTSSFTVNEGTSATITFSPDNGYRIKNVKVNGSTVSVSNNQYTISSINRYTTVEVEFEAIPLTTYTLSITASGNGTASYDGTDIRSKTSAFTITEGTNAIIMFTPDNGYRIKSVKLNGSDVTSYVSNNSYTISNITKNTSLEVEFAEELKTFTSDGINYSVSSYDNKTIIVGGGDYGRVLDVPAEITYQDIKWRVIGIDNAALAGNTELAAIIWNPAAEFTLNVSNPNLLLYVTSASYAPSSITNVIVNGTANKIVLVDAASGNDFYCPNEFTAKSISYTHNYLMTTGIGESRGWETIALPFDVQKITHSSKGELTPFANWKSGDGKKPFWLMGYETEGWTDAGSILANTPYIISMPNHQDYKSEYRINGSITFYAENATVKRTDDLKSGSYNGNTFVPSYVNADNSGYYALNVNNDYVSYYGESVEGSRFVANLRPVRPFEAYLISSSSAARSIAISDDMTTGIKDINVLIDENMCVRVYNMKGQLVIAEMNQSLEDVKKRLPAGAGVYIVNGKKLIIK